MSENNPSPADVGRGFYELPDCYDIAFSWDITRQVDFLVECFARHAAGPVTSVLEPGCGTGRFLIALSRRGIRAVGYDASDEMVDYTRRKIAAAGLDRLARIVPGDMRTAVFAGKFDAAANMINTFAYLLAEEDVIAHLRNTARALRSGGVYVVQLYCVAPGEPLPAEPEDWTSERNGLRVRTLWTVEREDPATMLSHQRCVLTVENHAEATRVEECHTFRLWYADDFRRIVAESGVFAFAAIYSEDYAPLPLHTRADRAMGNVYYVLRAI